MLSPEEDFDTWVFLFKECCSPKGDYLLLLPDFTRIISFYAENSSLPESINDFTYEFINDSAFSLLNSIFELTYLSEEELVKVKDAIKLIINSSTIGYKNNAQSCDKLLITCLKDNQSFYQKNYNSYKSLNTSFSDLYSEIFQYFLKEGPLQNLLDITISHPTIENLTLFSSIFINKLYHFHGDEGSQLLAKIQDPFIKFFSQFDNSNLRDADKKSLTEIAKFLGQYITPDEMFSQLRDSFLNFGNLCLRSSYVDKNLIGSEIFSKISTTFPESFQKFAKDTQLLDFILSTDLHETVLLQISPIASCLFMNDKPSIEQLNQIYTKIELSPPSLKEAFYKILVNILTSCDRDTIELFMKKLTDEKKLNLDLINFLHAYINEAATKNPEGATYITRYILSLLDKDTNDFSIVREAIDMLSKCVMTFTFRQNIFDYLMTKISSGPIPDEQYHSIKQLIKSIIITGGEEIKQLIDICISNNQTKLIKSITMSSSLKLPANTLQKLTVNKEGWSILSKVIKKRGVSAFESSPGEFTAIIKNLDIEQATMTEFLVVKEFLLAQNVESKKVTTYAQSNSSIGSYFRVIDPRIDGTDTIMKFITITKDEKVNENALLFLLELYNDASPVYFNLFAYEIYKELRSEKVITISQSIKNNSDDLLTIFPKDQQLILSKLLKMITSMINLATKKIDISESPIKSHKPLHEDDITFTVRFGDESKDVTCSSSITGGDLDTIISNKFNRRKEYYTILTESGSTIKYPDSLSSSGVHNGSFLVVADPDKVPHIQDTGEKVKIIEIISSNETAEIYFNMIKVNDLEKELLDEIWKFLMLMPSVQNITLESLNEAKSQMEIRYIIQFFKNNNDESSLDEIHTKIIDMICHDQIQIFALSDALNLIRFHMNFKSEENAKLFIEFLLNSLINEEMSKTRQLLIDVLITYSCRYQPFLTSQLLSDEKRFSEIILKTPNPHFPRLSAIFSQLTNYSKAFSMLLSLIEKVINREDIIDEYFKLLSTVLNDSCDFGSAINACIRLLDQKNDQSSLKFVSCTFLSTIFSKKPSLITEYSSKLFEPLLKTVFLLSDTNQQETIIHFLLLFCKDDEKCKSNFFNALYDHFNSIKTDRWSYDPTMNIKSETGFNGLRNLGATCYMNSVFQQLFFNFEFIKNIIKNRYEEECLIQLRALFIKMLKSVRGVVDTSSFVSNWKINNQPVNPREQQDACEFLLRILDKLHDELYKGEQVSINEGENADYRSESVEPFWNLQLEVKGRSSFEDSFQSYLQKISVSGYFAENLNRKINIYRYFRIKKAPKYLIVQLNRFEYDIVTWNKVKINDKFVFPLEFDLAPLIDSNNNNNNNNQKILYSLVGLINHCGTSEGGHYMSYIKHGEKWYNFNDSNVSEAVEKTLLDEAYGTEKKTSSTSTSTSSNYYEEDVFNRQSAYLLFYVRKESFDTLMKENQLSIEKVIDSNSNDQDSELLKQIEEDNNEYIHLQSAFGKAMLNTVMNLDDIRILTTYFLNIFTHSRDSSLTSKFSDHYIEIIMKNNFYDFVLNVFNDKKDVVLESILHSDSSVSKSIQDVISTVIEHCKPEKCREFGLRMIEYIPTVINNWRVVHKFFEILMIYCNKDIDYIRLEKISQKLFSLIKLTLETNKSSVYLKNVNFSSFFIFINDHIKEEIIEKESLIDLCNLSNIVLQSSENCDSFMKVVKSCSELGIIEMTNLIEKLVTQIKEASPSLALSILDQFIINGKVDELINNPRFSKLNLVNSIGSTLRSNTNIDAISNLRSKLIDNGIVLFYLITCDDHKAVKEMESIYLELFPEIPALNNYPRAEDAKNTYEKMVWNDQESNFVIKNDDNIKDEFLKILSTFIIGIDQINKRPEKYFYGYKLHKKLNQMIRVFIWLTVRSKYKFTDEEMKVIFKFFEIMHQQSIKNNTMMIEMCRLLRVLSRRDLIIQNFEKLLSFIFCSDYDTLYYKSIFIVFIEALKNDIISNPNLFYVLASNEGFEKSLFAALSSNYTSVFNDFIEILNEINPDISSLIERNLSHYIRQHSELILISIPYANKINEKNLIDDSLFEELIAAIYSLCTKTSISNDLFNTSNYDALKKSFDYIHNEFSKRNGKIFVLNKKVEKEGDQNNEVNINTIRSCITFVCSMLNSPTYDLYNRFIAQFIIDTAMSNIIFEDDIITTILQNKSNNNKGVMNLMVLSRIGNQDIRNNVGIELSTNKINELNSFLIEMALYLIDRDGIQDWTRKLINNICSSNENVILLMPDLFSKISTLLNVDELQKIAELLNECGNKEKTHVILEKIFEKRPEVKEQVLAAANIEDDRF